MTYPIVTQSYNWNDTWRKVQNFGLTLVDNQQCDRMCREVNDNHTITHRLFSAKTKEARYKLPAGMDDIFPSPLELGWVQIFAIKPHSYGVIHKDGLDRLCAFNVPIQNCNQGIMEYFDCSGYDPYTIDKGHTRIRILVEEIKTRRRGVSIDITPSFSTLVDRPMLVNTNEWHRVNNTANPNYRWMLSFRFASNPTFEEAQAVLQNCDFR